MLQIYSVFVILWHLLSAFFPSIKHYTLPLPLFQFIPFEIHENKLSPSSPLPLPFPPSPPPPIPLCCFFKPSHRPPPFFGRKGESIAGYQFHRPKREEKTWVYSIWWVVSIHRVKSHEQIQKSPNFLSRQLFLTEKLACKYNTF